MFYISAESRRRSQWLTSVVKTTSELVSSADTNDFTFKTGYSQEWGNTWWDEYKAILANIELPNIRHDTVSLSPSQRKREITPVVPVFDDSVTYKVGQSALYMNSVQTENFNTRLKEEGLTLLPKVKVPKDNLFTQIVKNYMTMSIEAGDSGGTNPPLKQVVCKDKDGEINTRTVCLAPIILLRAFDILEDSALTLPHELRHYQQHSHDPRPHFSTFNLEIDAYMFIKDFIDAISASRESRFYNAKWLTGSQSYARGAAIQAVIGQEDVRTLSRNTIERLQRANPF